MHMNDGLCLRPRAVDIHVHAPLGRWQVIAAIAAVEVHFDDVLRPHGCIGNTRGGDKKPFVDPCTDIAGGALVNTLAVHPQASGDNLSSGLEVFELRHGASDSVAAAGISMHPQTLDSISVIASRRAA